MFPAADLQRADYFLHFGTLASSVMVKNVRIHVRSTRQRQGKEKIWLLLLPVRLQRCAIQGGVWHSWQVPRSFGQDRDETPPQFPHTHTPLPPTLSICVREQFYRQSRV